MRLRWLINALLAYPLRALCVSVALIAITVISYRYYTEQQHQNHLHQQAEAEELLRQKFEHIVTLQLEDKTPLRTWLAEFTKQTGILVEIEDNSYRPRAATFNMPVTLPLPPLPAHEWLETLSRLYRINFRLLSQDGSVLSELIADSQRFASYPSLVRPNLPLAEQATLLDSFIYDWEDVGGSRELQSSAPGLLVLHPMRSHFQTAKLQERLDEAYRHMSAMPSAGLAADDPAWEPTWLEGEPAVSAVLQQALEQPITLRVVDMPCDDFAAALAQQAKFPVIWDPRDLFAPEAGFLITCDLKGIPLKHVLREWQPRGEEELRPVAGGRLLMICRLRELPDDCLRREMLFAYPVQDFDQDARGPDEDYLVDLLEAVIEPNSWADFGGAAQAHLTSDDKLLLVAQSLERHRQIRELLQQLRGVQNGEFRTAMCKPDPPLPVMSAEVQQRLSRSMSFYFCGVDEARAFEEICIRGDIHLPGFQENSILGSEGLWCNLPAQPLRDNLELLFTAKGYDLQYLEQVANPEEKPADYDDSKLLVTEVFDLRPWLTAGSTTLSVDELVRKVIHPETWADNGGTGQAIIFRDSLVVRSHPRVMSRVRDLLAALDRYSTMGQAKVWRKQSLVGDALNKPLDLWGPNDLEVIRQKKFAARNSEIEQKLKQRVSVNLQKKKIRTALLDLAREYQLPMILHELPSLGRAPVIDPFGGLTTPSTYVSLAVNDDRVSIEARDQPLGEILQQLIGDPAELVWLVNDGRLTITSPGIKLVDQTPGHLYCVDDLIMPRGPLRPKQLIRTLEMAVRDTDGDGDFNDESPTDPQVVSLEFHIGNLLWFNQDQSNIDDARFEAMLRDLRSGKLKPVEALKGDSDYSKPYSSGPRRNGCYSTIPIVGMNSPAAEVRR